MSHEGMLNDLYGDIEDKQHATQTTETEEEYAVIDRGDDYKLSIMRKKRPLVTVKDDDTSTADHEPRQKDTGEFGQFPRFGQPSQDDKPEEEYKKDDEEEVRTPNSKTDEENIAEIVPRNANSTMNIRNKFMQKLSQNRMMDPSGSHRPKTHQTIIIWDWDDTLMSSTFLSPY